VLLEKRSFLMPTDPKPDKNTYILGAESGPEMARLMDQDRLLTHGMGGLFPERNDVSTMRDMLDIACGPGGWALDVAHTYQKMNVAGIDVSPRMIEYARTQAWSQGLENASFRVMNVLEPLDFPDDSFDLVNARFLVGFMPQSGWSAFLQDCRRITRPGGIVRLTEFDEPGTTNSTAFEAWKALTFCAVRKAGFSSSPDGHNYGILPSLGTLLRTGGFQHIGLRAHAIDFSAGTDSFETMFQNCSVAFQLVQPFLLKMDLATQEEMDEMYQQMLIEMMQENFSAIWSYMTVWGQNGDAISANS
ncbi:MAG: class I SAM-dependent methyltransferase, partial [Ktedonobacteraceae bacterium]